MYTADTYFRTGCILLQNGLLRLESVEKKGGISHSSGKLCMDEIGSQNHNNGLVTVTNANGGFFL
jgi:hypothetical protein